MAGRKSPRQDHVSAPSGSNGICSIDSPSMSCESFKVFSRRYILRKTSEMLYKEPDETEYHTYRQHLLNLEKYFENPSQGNSFNDLAVALKNAWYLSQYHEVSSQNGTTKGRDSCIEIVSSSLEISPDTKYAESLKIIQALLSVLSEDDKYSRFLNELCNVEE